MYPLFTRALAEAEGGEEHFGVHIAYTDLYASIVFFTAIYAAGVVSSKLLKMPALVGEIFCGILMGPNLFQFVPNVEAFVMLGEIGLILLVLEAGIDIDLTTLKLIGARGVAIALVGTFLPILIAFGIAFLLGYRGVAAIAAGCSFAPTSLGIAMNVLRQAGVANTPTGQLIVAAAIIDDMIALVILSQLQAFTGDQVTIVDMAVPIVSALAFLCIGGYIAVFVLPKLLDRFVLEYVPKITGFSRDWVSMAIMFLLVLALIPTTYYGKASPLMGAFLAGLVFCSDSGAHHMFVVQFKRVMQWLLRIFFAASIGFQVPIGKFANTTVLLQGLCLTLALLGKVGVGFMAPNFSLMRRFKDLHLRDCLVVGFSMAAEGEFAFVIAAFAVTNDMITQDLYASIVLAVLISTIVAPFCLRFTISHFNKCLQETLFGDEPYASLEEGIRKQTTVFYCIQIKSVPAWGIQSNIMQALCSLELDVIDHRSFAPRMSENLLVNEIYAKDASQALQGKDKLDIEKMVDGRVNDITGLLENVIGQADAIVKTKRWYPEPFMADPSAGDINQRLVQATGTALTKSMREQDSYVEMGTGGGAQRRAEEPFGLYLDSPVEGIEGKLDGLIRHDQPLAMDSEDGIELLHHGTDHYDSHGVRMEMRKRTFTK